MQIIIDPKSNYAIYEQIVTQIRYQITNGTLKENDPLPSIRGLAASLCVSVITTKRAYEELEKEGAIRSVAGKGFYVNDINKSYLKEKQLISLEKLVTELVNEAKLAKVSKEDLLDMVSELY